MFSVAGAVLAASAFGAHRWLAGEKRAPTTNAEAYQEYIQGRYHWGQRSEAALTRSIAHFRRAIELDPGFALAHAGLANAHTTLGYLGYATPVSTFPVARPFALKALELDPSLAEAHASLAYIKFYFDWDWAGAREEFRRAIELDPRDPVTRQWHAVYLLAAGLPREAFDEIQAAHRLDPLSLAINTDIGLHHYYNRRYPASRSPAALGAGDEARLPACAPVARPNVPAARPLRRGDRGGRQRQGGCARVARVGHGPGLHVRNGGPP
jgi:Tfp pilus assembly protein PilF